MKLQFIALLMFSCLYGINAAGQQNTMELNETAPPGVASAIATETPTPTVQPAYARFYTTKVPTNSDPDIWSPPEKVQIGTTYKNGFNQATMSVSHNSNLNGSSVQHMVQPFDVRFRQNDMGFPAYSSASYQYTANTIDNQKAFYLSLYPGEGSTSAAITKNISTAAQRGAKTMAPGKTQIGQDRGATSLKITNGVNDNIRIWELNSNGKPVSTSFYAANELFGEINTDASGGQTKLFTDKDGRLILKAIWKENVVSYPTVLQVFATTLYVYDDYGHLAYSIPPKAYQTALGGSITDQVLDELCFQYRYDDRGRLKTQRKPGESGFTEMVYDRYDRLVMRRTPQEASAGKWEVTYYDRQGRVKGSSLLEHNGTLTYWQDIVDNATPGNSTSDLTYYLLNSTGFNADLTGQSIAGNTMMSFNWYDNYEVTDPNESKWGEYASQILPFNDMLQTEEAVAPVRSHRVQGLPTGSKIRILTDNNLVSETGQWTEQTPFYDDEGRVIFMHTLDHDGDLTGPMHAHYAATQYDFNGRPLVSKHKMYNKSAVDNNDLWHTELTRNFYHPQTGQLTKTMHKNDNFGWVITSMFSYDQLGRIKRKVLGNYGEVQDFVYNIRGQLTGINAVYAETGNKQGESRTFGQTLKYDFGVTQPNYDGKLAGIIWRGSDVSKMFSYGYHYEKGGSLIGADFRWKSGSGAWNTTGMDYSVSNLQYDLNGNIMTMDQKGPGGNTSGYIDQLSYTYQGNQLVQVEDAVPSNTGSTVDFKNGATTTTEFDYDLNGNLTADDNKGITSVSYNHLNKPEQINMSGGNSIANIYDVSGTKVRENTLINNTLKKREYIGNYIYDDGKLAYVMMPEGRSVWDKDNSTFNEEFFVKDNLGNVRSVVDVYTYPVMQYLATYELASANLENLFFDNVDEVRDERPGATWNGDLMSARLNGEIPDRRTGTSLLLKVMAGDKVEMNVNNYYENYDAQNDNPLPWEDMFESVVNTLTSGVGGTVEGEFHDSKRITDNFTYANMGSFENLVSSATDPSKPKAYLNYILFDENMRIVESSSGSFQANGNGTWTQIGTTIPMEIPQNGFLAVYLNNRSQMACQDCANVFFDQLVVRFSKGKLLEETHYYPYGLPMGGIGGKASGLKLNRHRYQGNEYVQEAGLNWMDFNNRQYDPQIGRFLSVDPLAAKTDWLNPYASMNNNPATTVDPLGLSGENMEYNSRAPMVDPMGPARGMILCLESNLGIGDLSFFDWGSGASADATEKVEDNAGEKAAETSGDAKADENKAGDEECPNVDPSSTEAEDEDTCQEPEQCSDEENDQDEKKKAEPEKDKKDDYKNSENNPTITVEQFRDIFKGQRENQILPKERTIHGVTFRTGLDDDYRYVSLANGKEVDMLHFLSVGRKGQFLGFMAEVQQYSDDNPSAFQEQDFYSNKLGVAFFRTYGKLIEANPTQISNYVYKFLTDPGVLNPPKLEYPPMPSIKY